MDHNARRHAYDWENEGADEGGLLGLGFTGLMTNGVDDYESLFDPATLTAGGAAGVFTIDSATAGRPAAQRIPKNRHFNSASTWRTKPRPLLPESSVAGALHCA